MARIASFDPEAHTITLALSDDETAMLAQTAAEGATIATYLRVDPDKTPTVAAAPKTRTKKGL